ncbi:hypothetical protein FKP32DRAFT_1681377 [Trametes sanguinea]|nr:hypothetical protein FKP32DRAFT_1681377 [Trametes sanguinea]
MSEPPQTTAGRKRPLTDQRAHEFIGEGKSRRVGQQTHALHLELVKNADIVHDANREKRNVPTVTHPQSFGPRPQNRRPLPNVPQQKVQLVRDKTTQKARLGREPSFHVDPQPAQPHRGQIIC